MIEVEERKVGEKKQSERERILKVVTRTLGDNYTDFEFVGEGAQSYILRTRWGPAGSYRSVKVDKTNIEHPRAAGYARRGYTTRNHINTLADLEEAEAHHIIGLVDFRSLPEEGISISVHKYIEGKTLDHLITSEGPLSLEATREIFSPVLDAMKYWIERGYVHRDLGTSNVMVSGDRGRREVSVIDFGIAGERGKDTGVLSTTHGNRYVRDPLNILSYNPNPRAYDFDSDFYSFGSDLWYGLTGRPIFELDTDKNIARACSTGESLLDKERFNKILEQELATMPKNARKLARVIRRCMTLDEDLRYGSAEELEKDFEKAFEPGFWGKLARNWKAKVAIAALTALPLSGIATKIHYDGRNKARQLEQKVDEESKYVISTRFDGGTLEYKTNLFDLDINLVNLGNNYELLYGENYRGGKVMPSVVHLNRGDRLQLTAFLREKPRPSRTNGNTFPNFSGVAYIEGWDAKSISAYPEPCDSAVYADFDGLRSMPNEVELKIPENIPDGNYVIAVNFYAHDKNTKVFWDNSALKCSRYENPGKILATKRVPIVIGKPEEELRVTNLSLDSISGLLYIHSPDKMRDIRKGITYEFYIPELEFKHSILDGEKNPVNCFGCTPGKFLPKPTDYDEKTLIISAKDSAGRIIMYEGFPIGRDSLFEKFPEWKVYNHGKDFPERLARYRGEVFNQTDKAATSK